MTQSSLPDIAGYKRLSWFHKQGGMGLIYHGYAEKTDDEAIIKFMDLWTL